MTSAQASFPRLFSEIDDLTRGDHSFLTDEDRCFFLGDYTARRGFDHSATNQLIQNFKKPMDRRGRPEWRHKENAIRDAATALRSAFASADLSEVTFVPVPPSKIKSDPAYDDRVVRMLRLIRPGLDVRELVLQRINRAAAHGSEDRRDPDALIEKLYIDDSICLPEPSNILICDDMLTTGCSFRAMQTVLKRRFPLAECFGIFLSRRVPEANEFPDFDF